MRYRPDDQWLGQLTVSVSIDGFSGIGVAWFSKETLIEFAEAIMAFPLPADMPPSISGGLGGNDKIPPQEVVTLTFEPHDARGRVRATVHVATEIWNGKERDLGKDATTRFLVSYGDLARFAPDMLDMVEGRSDEAVLTSTP